MGIHRLKQRKICVVTGSRADYGHLRGLMREIQGDPRLQLQLVVTGMHLAARFGFTYKMIQREGFLITERVGILCFDDSPVGIAQSIGSGCRLFARTFSKIKPDILVLLGDRYEMLAAAIAAYMLRIPIAHLHGGESSEGAVDEGIRHSITKMAVYHFTAAEIYRRRVIQMGEEPQRVFHYGAPGLDGIHKARLLNKAELAEALDFDLSGPTAMITYHPATLDHQPADRQIQHVLKAIRRFSLKGIFTQSNADAQGRVINRRMEEFCFRHPQQYKFIRNLGQLVYLSCLKHFDLMIGNSSSGIIEAPSFHLPVVNIGDRQRGRLHPPNVIDADCSVSSIQRAIALALSPRFRLRLKYLVNPYVKFKDGKINYRIKEKLRTLPIHPGVMKKKFFAATDPHKTGIDCL